MYITLMKSKIHKATITQTELQYEGSITIDEDLMLASNIHEFEKVQVVNLNNGIRLETYVIKGEKGSKIICLNGPAARKGCVGDKIIIITYVMLTYEEVNSFSPNIVKVNDRNEII